MNTDRSEKSEAVASPAMLFRKVIPLLKCEINDVRDAAVNALGMINHDAVKYEKEISLKKLETFNFCFHIQQRFAG